MSLYSKNLVVKIPTILAKNTACFLNFNRVITTFRYNKHILDEWKSCAASCNTPQPCNNICNWHKVGRKHWIYLKAVAITYNLENNRPHYVNLGRRRIEAETRCNITCQWMLTCNYSPRVKQSTEHRECDHSERIAKQISCTNCYIFCLVCRRKWTSESTKKLGKFNGSFACSVD